MCYTDDRPDFYRDERRRARTAHKCGECNRVIEAGETYEATFAVMYGDAFATKTCRHCISAREWLAIVCNSWQFHNVLDDLREHHAEYPDVTPGWLAVAIECMSRRWRRRDGRLMNPMSVPKIPADMRGIA